MAIQKPSPGTSYAELRKKNPPKRTERKVLNVKPRQIAEELSADAIDHERPSLKVVPAAAVETGEAVEVSPNPPSSPLDAPHAPASAKAPVVPATTESDQDEINGQTHTAKKASRADARGTPRRPVGQPTSKEDQIGVRGSIAVPARGAFELFDKVAEHYGEPEALKMLLDAALKSPPTRLANGDLAKYPVGGKKVRAYRMVPMAHYEEYRQAVDPLGIMPAFKVGSLYLQRVLAHYHAAQGTRQSKT